MIGIANAGQASTMRLFPFTKDNSGHFLYRVGSWTPARWQDALDRAGALNTAVHLVREILNTMAMALTA